MVHEKGLEPSRQLALVPKTSVSTNSTTRAYSFILSKNKIRVKGFLFFSGQIPPAIDIAINFEFNASSELEIVRRLACRSLIGVAFFIASWSVHFEAYELLWPFVIFTRHFRSPAKPLAPRRWFLSPLASLEGRSHRQILEHKS